jgi:hypothetical protein
MGTAGKNRPTFRVSAYNNEKIAQAVTRASALADASSGRFEGQEVVILKAGRQLTVKYGEVDRPIIRVKLMPEGNRFEYEELNLDFRPGGNFLAASAEIDSSFERMQAQAAKELRRKAV